MQKYNFFCRCANIFVSLHAKYKSFVPKTMKRHIIILLAAVFLTTVGYAATLIHIDDPQNWSAASLGKYVGQEVTFDVPMIVCSTYSGLKISPWRTMSITNQCVPNSNEFNSYRSTKGEITLSGYPSVSNLRLGMRLVNLTVRVNSTSSVSYVSGKWSDYNSREYLEKYGYNRADVDADGKHTLLVCAMNCEYYLTDYSKWGASDNTSGQGPKNNEVHQKQRAKVSKALAKINADIYGLVEVQLGQGALQEIAYDLTRNTGRTFKYISDGGTSNGSFTKSGYVYCADAVEPIDAMINNDNKVQNRKKLQLFRDKKSGGLFYYSINHFKAKSGAGSGADADRGDGQGSYNYTRTMEAQSVINEYGVYNTNDRDFLIMGDLNAYGMEDPIRLFTDNGFTDLHRYFHADSSYSYTFHNEAGYLDHAIASPTMLQQVTGMTPFHINSDEDDRYTYDKSNDQTMFRCSDHDPIIVGLKLRSDDTENMDENTIIDLDYTRIVDQYGHEIDEGEMQSGQLYFIYEYGENPNGKNIRRIRKILCL